MVGISEGRLLKLILYAELPREKKPEAQTEIIRNYIKKTLKAG